ncbi:MAG: universal stress protein [Nitrincola lacisaponensis]|uniref:Universal stress protein n=1 Tax=Nitrincola lacisaponensis TaxID=267850 RepID=A0A063XYI2_9GAMM|nr:universal stress protein [Nitrincola lacisaponensis]KDE38559.1 Universal stress protein family [Nitrincola lacisaponensis]
MSTYSHILLAIDLSDESDQLITKAAELARLYEAELDIIHVVEPLTFAYGGDVPMDLSTIQEQLDEHAEQKLNHLCATIDHPVSRRYIVTGHTESEIHRVAKEIAADLIIVGSHGRHGLALLLGSTANGVLHGAQCDVLAIRVRSQDS